MLQLLLIVSAPGAKRSIVFQPGTTWRRLTEPLQESAWHHGERLLDQLEKGYWIKQREKTRQLRRPANLPARFAFRQQRNSETTQNWAGATPNKNHTNPHRVSEICTNELRVCGPNKLKGGEKLSNCKNQQHGLRKANLPYGSHLRVLFFCGRRPLPFGGSHLRLPSGPAGIRTTTGSLSALARPTPYQLSHRVA